MDSVCAGYTCMCECDVWSIGGGRQKVIIFFFVYPVGYSRRTPCGEASSKYFVSYHFFSSPLSAITKKKKNISRQLHHL